MVDNMLGERLYNAGWSQGTLLPVLPWSVIYHVDDPLNKISRTAKRQGSITINRRDALTAAGLSLTNIGVAYGITRSSDYLVIASQDCDIVSKLSEEPNVVAMRAFITDNENILRYADGNSAHYFLLDYNRRLVAESSIMVMIEKPVLVNFTPELGVLDITTKERFARWVAHRFNRVAFPENVVGAVIQPILDNFSKMREDNDPDLSALDIVREVRLGKIVGSPPYDVRLLFIIPETGLPDKGIALARLVSRIRNWFNPLAAHLVAWDAFHIYQISHGDYLATQQIYLDHYTYRGQTIRGLLPLPQV